MTDFTDQVKLKGSTPSLTNDQVEKSLLVSAGGSGYTSAPSVTITGGDGSGANATASIEGIITGIPITNNGSGYTSASISFSGSGGAAATPIISNGQIIAIRIDNGGYYSSPPTVTITGNGSGATAQATMSVSDITVTNHGSGFTSDPTVTISNPTGPETARNTAAAYAKRKSDGSVDVFLGTFPRGSSYLTFDDNSFNPEKTADWLLFTTSEAPHSPLLGTNQGVVMEKDLIVGGFVDSGQGALLLNYGLLGKPTLASPPCILLMKSDQPYPSGGTLPSNPENGQLYNHSGNKKMWNGNDGVQNWITDNNAHTGYYDTLFLFKKDGITPANLDLGNLTIHGNITIVGSILNLATQLASVIDSTLHTVGGFLGLNPTSSPTFAGLSVNGGLTINAPSQTGITLGNGTIYWQTATNPDVLEMNCGLIIDGALNVNGISVNGTAGITGVLNLSNALTINSNAGSSGQVLTSNGSGNAPTWQTAPGWNGGTVTNPITAPSLTLTNTNAIVYSSGLEIALRPRATDGMVTLYNNATNRAFLRCYESNQKMTLDAVNIGIDNYGNTLLGGGATSYRHGTEGINFTTAYYPSISLSYTNNNAKDWLIWALYDDDSLRFYLSGNNHTAGSDKLKIEASGNIEVYGYSFRVNPVGTGNTGIEIGNSSNSGGLPFIDFHYGVGSAQDYNVRIINDANGQLSLVAAALNINGSLYGSSGTLNIGTDTTISHANTTYFNVNSTNGSSAINLQQGSSTKGMLGTDGTSKVYLNTSNALNLELDASGGVIYAKNDFVAQGLLQVNKATPTLNLCLANGDLKIDVGYDGSNGYINSRATKLILTGQGGTNDAFWFYGGHVSIRGGYHITPEAYEGGECGNTSHRWYRGWFKYIRTLGPDGSYDLYDDLAIVKQWGEPNPKLPDDYDPTKQRPEGAVFDFLKKDENGNLDTYFNLNKLVGFGMDCIKTLAKKYDELSDTHGNELLTLRAEIENLRSQIQKLQENN